MSTEDNQCVWCGEDLYELGSSLKFVIFYKTTKALHSHCYDELEEYLENRVDEIKDNRDRI